MQEKGENSSHVEKGAIGTQDTGYEADGRRVEPCSAPLYHSTTQDMYNNIQKVTTIAIASAEMGWVGA